MCLCSRLWAMTPEWEWGGAILRVEALSHSRPQGRHPEFQELVAKVPQPHPSARFFYPQSGDPMPKASPQNSPRAPVPRTPGFEFESDIPRHWFGDNVVATHLSNGVNLLFPAGERFFVRSVHYYLAQIDEPELLAQVRGFAGQEGRHAREHEHFFERLELQGFEIRRFLRFYERLAFEVLESRVSPALRLSVTAACEHFTAVLASEALRHNYLDNAHPKLQELLRWHAAEEIEHRAVAFDVLQRVNPSYALRIVGLLGASICLSAFWAVGTGSLLVQDRQLGLRRFLEDWQKMREQRKGRRTFWSGLGEYLRPSFHPLQKDLDHLAEGYLSSAGMGA